MSETTEVSVPDRMHIPADGGGDKPHLQENQTTSNPRDAIMRGIAAKYDETQRAEEMEHGETLLREAAERDGGDVTVQEPERPTHAETAGAVVEDVAPAGTAVVEPVVPHPAAPASQPQLRTVMVQGQPLQVTEDQLIQLAQMGAVANLALQQPQVPVQQPAQAVTQAPVLDRDRAAAIVQRLSYGSPDDGVAALQDLVSSVAAQQPQVDAQAIRQQAVQDALAHIQFQSDLRTIGAEFPTVFNNRSLAVTAAYHLTEIRQRDALLGQQRPAIEQYREAARMVQDAVAPTLPQSGSDGQVTAPQAAIQVGPVQDRVERKRAAPRNVVGVSRAASLGDSAPSTPSGSAIVEQMRKQRQQTPVN